MPDDVKQDVNQSVNTEVQPQTPQPIGFDQWSAHIPPDMKDKGYWALVKDQPLATVLKNYGAAQERMGKSILLPEKDDKEGQEKLWNKLGRPETPDKYQYKLPEHKSLKWDENVFKDFAKTAHSLGATNEQVAGLIDWFTKDVMTKNDKYANEMLQRHDEVVGKLKKEYGTNYDANIAIAKRAAVTYFGAEVGEKYIDDNIHNEPVVRGLVKLGLQLAEDGLFGKNPVEFQGAITREEAQKKINEIMGNRSHAYWGNPSDPATQAALLDVENLHKIAFPE